MEHRRKTTECSRVVRPRVAALLYAALQFGVPATPSHAVNPAALQECRASREEPTGSVLTVDPGELAALEPRTLPAWASRLLSCDGQQFEDGEGGTFGRAFLDFTQRENLGELSRSLTIPEKGQFQGCLHSSMNIDALKEILEDFARRAESTAEPPKQGSVLSLLKAGAIKAEANAPICATGAIRQGQANLPDDPLLHAQWGLDTTGVVKLWRKRAAWHQATGELEPVKIAILDSGLDPEQQDLAPCPSETSCDPGVDETGHGTAVAGVIGATTGNAFRVAGMDSGAEIRSYKVLDENNSGSIMDAVNGLAKAVEEEADIVSLAWGTATDSQCLWNAIRHAEREGVLVVTAAGNDGIDLCENPSFFPAAFRQHDDLCTGRNGGPACLKNLLVVGATDLSRGEERLDTRASFSSYGNKVVQIGAPGVGITTTGLEHSSRLPYEPDSRGLVDASGTSVATALVVGAAGLVAADLRAQDAASTAGRPSQTPKEPREAEVQGGDPFYQRILDRLLDGADRVCHLNDYFAEGRRLNVYKAVRGEPGESICPQDHHHDP